MGFARRPPGTSSNRRVEDGNDSADDPTEETGIMANAADSSSEIHPVGLKHAHWGRGADRDEPAGRSSQ